jgi:hypothetical protein
MALRRLDSSKVDQGSSVDQEIYEGPITEAEVRQLHKDPEAFLRKEGVPVQEGVAIHISHNRMVGPPANASQATDQPALKVSIGVQCRIIVVVIFGRLFAYIHCVPVIIIDDP